MLIRNEDEATGDIGCAGNNNTCDYPAVQTIRMSNAPWLREGDKLKAVSVGYEYVGLCEGHWAYHWPARAKWIPVRFMVGR